MLIVRITLGVLATALVGLSALTGSHLGLMAMASLLYRAPDRSHKVPPVRFLIVVPAHNEQLLLPRTLEALRAAMRPCDQLLVVDDRSTDTTAQIAERHGAIVVRRSPDDPPGRAAARQAALDHARTLEWDAMVMIDADSVVEPGYLDRCEAALARGALALQTRSEAQLGHRLVDVAALASFAIQGVTLPRGRAVLGLPVRLRGTGMVLRRELIDQLQFEAQASEDLQVTLDLVRQGVMIHHVDDARLRSANAGSWRSASDQKERYEYGRLTAARTYVPQLLRQRSRAGFEAAWYLASPPFAVAAGLAVAAIPAALVADLRALVIASLVVLTLLGWTFLVASVQARLGWRALVGALAAPGYIAWKLVVQLRAILALRRGNRSYGATDRSMLDGATRRSDQPDSR